MKDDNAPTKSPLSQLAAFSFSSMAAAGVLFFLRLGKNVVFTRLLGPEGRGLYTLLMTLPALVVSFGNLGFGLGSVYLAAKKKADPRALLGNILVFALLHGGILFLAGIGLMQLQKVGLLNIDGMESIQRFILAAIPLLLFHNLGMDLLLAHKDIHVQNLIRIAFALLPLIIMLSIFVFTGDALRASLYSWPASLAIVGALAFLRLRLLAGGALRVRLDLAVQALLFGLRGTVSQFANTISRRIDILLLAHYSGNEAVGFYAVAVSLGEILALLPATVSTPFLPIRLGLSEESGRRFSPLVIKTILMIMITICLGAALTAKPLIFILFGPAFFSSIAPLLFLLPGILALSMYEFFKIEVLGFGRPGFISLVSVMAMISNIALNLILIPAYGSIGAALSSSFSYSLSCACLVVFVAVKNRISIAGMLLPSREDISFLAGKISKLLKRGKSGPGADN